MCSIFGYYKLEKRAKLAKSFIKSSLKLMHHRGPDSQSFVNYDEDQVGLGNHRLSIIDTRKISNQPMESNKSSLVFNGEIYNYLELSKKYLTNTRLRTSSDTEVLQLGLDKYGLKFLDQTNGMFAFAWYNHSDKKLVLARDRFGVKPLHYTILNNVLYFSSEIKPLIYLKKNVERNTNIYINFINDTATDYSSETFVKDIFQIEKGEYLECKNNNVRKKRWYTGHNHKFNHNIFSDKNKTLDYFENLLTDSIRLRLHADVPVCMTISGGLDSTLIYTLIKEKFKVRVNLFSYVNQNSNLDETKLVKKIVGDYGDTLTLVRGDSHNLPQILINSLYSLEFPIWDISAVAYAETYKQIHQAGFKVVIEGHGSDELLGGYSYLILTAVKQLISELKLIKAFRIYRVYSKTDLSLHMNKADTFIEFLSLIRNSLFGVKSSRTFQQDLDIAFNYKILPVVLRTFDRLPMAYSLESRSPFMDYRVVEFLKELPMEYKVSEIGSKAILRELLKKYHKDYIYKGRKKIGFGLDYSKVLSDNKVKEFFTHYAKAFDNPMFKSNKDKAFVDLTRTDKRSVDMENIWKIAALSYTDSLYNITK